jgi:ATP/maltotriose-dependent transcriptional regulator MalT/DNA-binding SARP family transcriptional activator
LLTRLLPPRLPPGCIRRPQLEQRVVEGLSGRLVTVVAAAGYGKSTILVQALERVPWPAAWCSCDARIRHSGLLLEHLAAALASVVPAFGAHLELEGQTDDQVAAFCNESTRAMSADFVLVLDDVHTLSGSARQAVELLLRHLPPTAHVLLASRSRLPLPLARLRAAGAIEVGEADLAFSRKETQLLLRRLAVHHEPTDATDLHRLTEGWVSGLILAARTGRSELDRERAHGNAFDYLAEEVFFGLSARRRAFLLRSSVLDRFSPALAAAVTGEPESARLVHGFVADHLFTEQLHGHEEWYRYHHLLQAFLRRRLRYQAPKEVSELHRRAARWWLEGEWRQEAVPHLVAAGEPRAAVDVLEPLAEDMVGTPGAETLADWLDGIPQEHWADRPSLLGAHAALLLTRAEHEGSFPAFEAAIGGLLKLGDHERAAMASARLLQSMITAGAPVEERIEAGRRQIALVSSRARMSPATRILLATSYAWACRFEEAEEELRAALAQPAGDSPVVRAYTTMARAFYLTYPRGSVIEALAQLDHAIAVLERHRSGDELGLLAYARVYRGYLLNDLGRHQEALAEAERTERAFSERGFRRAVGRALRCIRLTALAGLERWHDLEAEFRPGAEERDPAEASSYGYRLRDPAARLAAHRGDVGAVQSHIAAAREQMRFVGPVFDNPMFLCNFARAAWDAGLRALAGELADEARNLAVTIGAPAQQARASLVGAFATGGERRADDLLAEALDLTARWDLTDLWLRRERGIAGPLLARARRRNLGPPGLAASLLAASGDTVSSQPSSPRSRRRGTAGDSARRGRPVFAFSTLGGLSVTRDGVPIPPEEFGRRKPRELLALLLSADRAVHRDAVVDHLWPTLDDVRGGAALRTALHQLRRALEPELAPRSPSALIVSRERTYSLVLQQEDAFDVATFLELSTPADEPPERVIRRLEAAEAAYRGPFLPEWPYADWAETRRRALEARYRGALGRLGAALLSEGRPDAAARRYERLVGLEPERERWHQALMQCYAELGERPLALRQYHVCREILRRELGIEPGPETRALFARLLRGERASLSLHVAR